MVAPEVTPAVAPIDSASVHDAATRLWGRDAVSSAVASGVRPVATGQTCAGPAHTIRISLVTDDSPRDGRDHFAAYAMVPEGAVVVVQVDGGSDGAIMGDVVAHAMRIRGAVGVVTDGAVRDWDTLAGVGGLPVWAGDVTMAALTPARRITEIGVDVTIGGARVSSGDLVVADGDGVVVVPAAETSGVLELATAIAEDTTRMHADLEAGLTLPEARARRSA